MKTQITILALFYSINVLSQTDVYHPFLHDEAEWSLLFAYESFEPFDTIYYVQNFHSGGDSLIAGQIYIKYKLGAGVFFLFRDDVANKKVYTLYDDGVTQKDTLLYDFNLAVGASASHSIEFLNYPDAQVADVDSIFIGDNYRTRIKIEYTNETFPDSAYWIEGIGSTNGIHSGPYDIFELPSYRKLICYSEASETLYLDLQDWYNCDSILIDQGPIIIDNKNNNLLSIFPNPFADFLYVKGDAFLINSIINARLIDLNGVFVSQIKIESDKLIFINQNFASGIYFLIIETPTNRFNYRIIKL